ncbi:hypothetical protein [Wocania arenilitoris]
MLSRDLDFINEKSFLELNNDINTIKRKIYSLKQKLN